mmetsp:Transcript_133604/g.415483  ORF Transcript_133604/g.415483 Transcript_133604/m.415483 type:complete len:298 (-) Transcript_133604:29-922(-)
MQSWDTNQFHAGDVGCAAQQNGQRTRHTLPTPQHERTSISNHSASHRTCRLLQRCMHSWSSRPCDQSAGEDPEHANVLEHGERVWLRPRRRSRWEDGELMPLAGTAPGQDHIDDPGAVVRRSSSRARGGQARHAAEPPTCPLGPQPHRHGADSEPCKGRHPACRGRTPSRCLGGIPEPVHAPEASAGGGLSRSLRVAQNGCLGRTVRGVPSAWTPHEAFSMHGARRSSLQRSAARARWKDSPDARLLSISASSARSCPPSGSPGPFGHLLLVGTLPSSAQIDAAISRRVSLAINHNS